MVCLANALGVWKDDFLCQAIALLGLQMYNKVMQLLLSLTQAVSVYVSCLRRGRVTLFLTTLFVTDKICNAQTKIWKLKLLITLPKLLNETDPFLFSSPGVFLFGHCDATRVNFQFYALYLTSGQRWSRWLFLRPTSSKPATARRGTHVTCLLMW